MSDARDPAAGLPPAGLFALYVLLVFALAGAFAPALYFALIRLGMSPEFHKLVFRLLEVLALLGLWPLLAALGIEPRRGFGLTPPRIGLRGLAACGAGFVVGCASLAAVAGLLLVAEVRAPGPGLDDLGYVAGVFARALVGAAVIATVEEIWFRGALHSVFERLSGSALAIAGTALIYATVHFVRPDLVIPHDAVVWSSGYTALGGMFDRFIAGGIADSFAALFAAGIWLAVVRHHRGDVALGIGIHAGWVVVIKVLRKTTETVPESPWGWFTGRYDGVIGWLAAAVFSVAALAYHVRARRAHRRPGT